MVIKNDTILYFSGTGNSLQVAKDISSKLDETKLCNIASLSDEKEIKITSKILGIVFPVYYARLPLIVEKIVKKLEISNDTYVFAAATYGGGPAEVLIKLKNMLQNNGKTLNSGFLFQMPGNNIFSYSAIPLKIQKKILEKEKSKVNKISDMIREKKDYKCEVSKIKIDIVIDRTFIKITDKIIDGFHMRDDKFTVNDKCTGCGLCEKICPVKNIEFNSAKPSWKHSCEQCAACIQYCPAEAIQWGNKTANRKRYKNPNVNVNELMEYRY